MPGTPFAVGYLEAPSTISGPAVGALVAGSAAIVFALLGGGVGLLEVRAAGAGAVTGAFAAPAVLVGGGAVVLGLVGRRQIRRAAPVRRDGRGLAVAGLVCGAVGVALALLALLGVMVIGLA